MKQKVVPLLLLITAILFLVLVGCATGSVRYVVSEKGLKTEGLSKIPEVWEDGYRTAKIKNAFEWWYFDASFDDGSTAVIVFSTKPITDPSAPLSPSVSIVITTPEGKRLASSVSFSGFSKKRKEERGLSTFFSASTSECDVRIGDSYAVGNLETYTVAFNSGKIRAKLHFVNRVGPWRPGSGIAHFGNKFFAWFPAVPYGEVTGELYYEGSWHSVNGSGYHDHNWGTAKLQDVLSQWYWGRAHVGNYTIIFSKMFTTRRFGDKRLYVFFLANGRKILVSSNRIDAFKTGNWRVHRCGREYPGSIHISFRSNYEKNVEITIDKPRIIEAMSLISGIPPVLRGLVKLFVNPCYFRFRANYTLKIGLETLSGKGIFEMMLLGGKHTIRDN